MIQQHQDIRCSRIYDLLRGVFVYHRQRDLFKHGAECFDRWIGVNGDVKSAAFFAITVGFVPREESVGRSGVTALVDSGVVT